MKHAATVVGLTIQICSANTKKHTRHELEAAFLGEEKNKKVLMLGEKRNPTPTFAVAKSRKSSVVETDPMKSYLDRLRTDVRLGVYSFELLVKNKIEKGLDSKDRVLLSDEIWLSTFYKGTNLKDLFENGVLDQQLNNLEDLFKNGVIDQQLYPAFEELKENEIEELKEYKKQFQSMHQCFTLYNKVRSSSPLSQMHLVPLYDLLSSVTANQNEILRITDRNTDRPIFDQCSNPETTIQKLQNLAQDNFNEVEMGVNLNLIAASKVAGFFSMKQTLRFIGENGVQTDAEVTVQETIFGYSISFDEGNDHDQSLTHQNKKTVDVGFEEMFYIMFFSEGHVLDDDLENIRKPKEFFQTLVKDKSTWWWTQCLHQGYQFVRDIFDCSVNGKVNFEKLKDHFSPSTFSGVYLSEGFRPTKNSEFFAELTLHHNMIVLIRKCFEQDHEMGNHEEMLKQIDKWMDLFAELQTNEESIEIPESTRFQKLYSILSDYSQIFLKKQDARAVQVGQALIDTISFDNPEDNPANYRTKVQDSIAELQRIRLRGIRNSDDQSPQIDTLIKKLENLFNLMRIEVVTDDDHQYSSI